MFPQSHFNNLNTPLSLNKEEVKIYEKYVYNYTKIEDFLEKTCLLLGYTKELMHLCDKAMDITPVSYIRNAEKMVKQDWFTINEFYDTIIGDGCLNLVNGNLVEHLSKHCNLLVIRFFTNKITSFLLPDEIIETQESCKILVWKFNNIPKRNPIKPHAHLRAIRLAEKLQVTQYIYKHDYNVVSGKDILTKEQLQHIDIPKGVPTTRTYGSTGTPVITPKTEETAIWHIATNLRDLEWNKWNTSNKELKIVSYVARNSENKIINETLHLRRLDTMSNIQKYLENVQPYYLYTYPSIVRTLDLSKLTNLISIRTCGETGSSSYSSEETGTIALLCPDNPELYHIMENMIVEIDEEHGVLITDLNNPVIIRYALSDHVELRPACTCDRSLPTIKKIIGRNRNMLILPNGDKVWPTIGEPKFKLISDKILRHKVT
jgi:hypothetical protein